MKKNRKVSNINAIIFDLGKVIIKTDIKRTNFAFKEMCKKSYSILDNLFENEYFQLFELGKISEKEFFNYIKKTIFLDGDIDSIVKAWDSMIVGITSECVKLLEDLEQIIPIFALSNTNVSHVKRINHHLLVDYQISDIQKLFKKVYYSYELGLGKPDKKIFEYVLSDIKLSPNNVLFIDDNFENVTASKEIGFQTIHLTEQNKLIEELKRAGILQNNYTPGVNT